MAKGIKYDFEIKLPKDGTLIFKGLLMKETLKQIEDTIKEFYFIEVSMSRNKIYNLLKRPETVSPMLKNIILSIKKN
tara:strand:- start:38 stop:268 length:231 start_codon:yes stop_codon:yes gene_type:complete